MPSPCGSSRCCSPRGWTAPADRVRWTPCCAGSSTPTPSPETARRDGEADRLSGMSQPPDLEARVAALEARVGELVGEAQSAREDAAAARHLAAVNDRDVAEIRGEIRDFRQATTGSFNAMRSDLTDLRTEMRNGFTEVRGQLDGTAAGLEQITGLLTTLIDQQGGDLPGNTE